MERIRGGEGIVLVRDTTASRKTGSTGKSSPSYSMGAKQKANREGGGGRRALLYGLPLQLLAP